MNNHTDAAVLVCPKCFAMADTAFVAVDGEVLWWYCRGCNFQGDGSDFLALTDQTNENKIKE